MSSAIAGFAVTPSHRSRASQVARSRPAAVAPPPLPSRKPRAPLSPEPPSPEPSRRNLLLSLLGAGVAHGAGALTQERPGREDPWLACGVEPYSEEALAESPTARALYPSGRPLAKDVVQGSLGDCYVLAALLAVVHKWPWHITQRIRVTGVDPDGTAHFKVGLNSHPRSGEAPRIDWICVSAKFPPPGARGALWVSLFEKAYAKHNDAYKVVRDPALQGYAALDIGGLGQGLEAITGKPARVVFFANETAPREFMLPRAPAGHVPSLFKRPRTAGFLIFGNWSHHGMFLRDGTLAQCAEFADGSRLISIGDQHRMCMLKGGQDLCVYGHHAYAVLDVNASGDILVRNPHGKNPNGKGAEFWLPRRCVDRMVVGYVATSV